MGMSLSFRVLGTPETDNALFVEVNSGQSVERLLFDCGEGCPAALTFAGIWELDHVFFSHFHMDHVSGFDSLFRVMFHRAVRENHIWGPPGTGAVMHHRFRGFLWNLHDRMNASWWLTDILPDALHTVRCELNEAFETAHPENMRLRQGPIVSGTGYTVEAIELNHHTPSIGYIVRERPRWNIDPVRMESLGLKPGPWVKALKEGTAVEGQTVTTLEGPRPLADLKAELMVETPGDSVAYLTDFLLDDETLEKLRPFLKGCVTLVCESQYLDRDAELADRNHHMTAVRAARLAKEAGVERLVLFHLSDRYHDAEWQALLDEARAVFPATSFPEHWRFAARDS